VAIKIAGAHCEVIQRELQVLRALDGAKYIVRLLDSFIHKGPNGNHQCLVLELLGPAIERELAEADGRFPPSLIWMLSKQLFRATESLHRAGYGHGGKLVMYSYYIRD
jgi:serine/threonine-protein kinase SRPK3